MRGTPLNEMPVRDLRETASALSNGNTAAWSKKRCIKWLTKNKVDKLGVGNFCRALLRVVVKKNNDGFTIGLNYAEIVSIVTRHFPFSAADETHLSWYATTMRARGEMIPVYRRERSK